MKDGFGSKDGKESEKKIDDKALLEMVTYKVGFQEGKQSKSKLERFTSGLLTTLLVASVLFFLVFRPTVNGVFGKISATEIMPEDVEVTFDDVRGCDEAKQELQASVRIVDHHNTPQYMFIRLYVGDRRISYEPGEVLGARREAPQGLPARGAARDGQNPPRQGSRRASGRAVLSDFRIGV